MCGIRDGNRPGAPKKEVLYANPTSFLPLPYSRADQPYPTVFHHGAGLRRGGFHGPDELPDPDIPLRQEDYLVLVGRAEHCRRLTDMTEKTTYAVGS